MEKIIWKSFLSFFLIWQSLFFGQSRADSSSFLKFRVLQGNQSKANLKTSTQSYLFYFGSFGIGLTEIDIKNETDSFKYDMKDLSLDLGFQMTSSFSIGAGMHGQRANARAEEKNEDFYAWNSKKSSGYGVFAHYGFNFGFLDFLIGVRSLRYSFEDFEHTSSVSTTTLSKPISGYSNLISVGLGFNF